jgi:hypothetical protein
MRLRRAHVVWPALALGLAWGLLRQTDGGEGEVGLPLDEARPVSAVAQVVSPAPVDADLVTVLPTDPAAALRHAAALARAQPGQAESIYAALLEPFAQRREHALLLEALALAPLAEDARERLRQEAAARWAETDPAGAATWARQTPPGAAPLLPVIHDRWINQDARSATAFASSLPGAEREEMLRESVSRWLALDGAAAREWLRSQGPQAGLDPTLAQHASSDELLRHRPDEALALAQRISDPALRWQTLVTMARHLDDIDPALTDQFPNRLPLMPDERERLLAEARAPLPVQQDP